jgi:hypothetical protein
MFKSKVLSFVIVVVMLCVAIVPASAMAQGATPPTFEERMVALCTMDRSVLPTEFATAVEEVCNAFVDYLAAQALLAAQPVVTPDPGAPVMLKYDETGGVLLPTGQTKLVADYLRIPGQVSQVQIEAAVAAIQAEAVAVGATTVVTTGTLVLDQHYAWLVWCPDATAVDPPADVSHVMDPSLLDTTTLGRVYIQVPFAAGVPLRTDDTWSGCTAFWAVAVK